MQSERTTLYVSLPIVHRGEALVMSEDTLTLHAEFEATALSDGARGESIMVRLRLGGKIVRANVSAPGRVVPHPDQNEDNR